MNEDQGKVQNALRVMNTPEPKQLSPIETIERVIDECIKDGFTPCAIALGQDAYICFIEDLRKTKSASKLDLVDALGKELSYEIEDEAGSPIKNIVEWKGMKVYKKSSPGFEPLFQ